MYSMCTCNIYLKQLIITIHLVYEKNEGKWKEKKIEKKSEKKKRFKVDKLFFIYYFILFFNIFKSFI